MRIIAGAFFAGLAAFYLAKGVGLPTFTMFHPGDAFDVGALTCGAVTFLAKRPAP